MKGYIKNPMVTARRMGDEMFLIPLSDDMRKIRKIYRLNELGWFIWQAIEGVESMEQLSMLISREFGVERSVAFKDTEGFIGDLIRAGALDREGEI